MGLPLMALSVKASSVTYSPHWVKLPKGSYSYSYPCYKDRIIMAPAEVFLILTCKITPSLMEYVGISVPNQASILSKVVSVILHPKHPGSLLRRQMLVRVTLTQWEVDAAEFILERKRKKLLNN